MSDDPYAGIAAPVGQGDPYAGIAQLSPYARARADADKITAKSSGMDRAINQGASLGFGDEIGGGLIAGATAVKNSVDRLLGKTPAYGASDAYHATVDSNRAAIEKYGQEHPVANAVFGVLGGLPGGGGSAAKSLGQAAFQGAATGGVMGGIAGAGNAQGGLEPRAKGALRGALTGAAVGAAVPVVVGAGAKIGRGLARTANKATGGALLSPEREAQRRIAEAIMKDGAPTSTNPNLSLMDVAGEETRALARAAGTKGPARTQAAKYADTVAADLQDRAIGLTRGLTPETRPAADIVAELANKRSTLATQDYAPVYAEVVDVPDDIRAALQGSPGKAAIQRAMRGAEANQRTDQMVELQTLLDGSANKVSAGVLDRIRIAMGERAGKAFQQGARDIGAGLTGRTAAIDAGLDTVPGLGAARSNYRDLSGQLEAVPLGQSAMNARPDEYQAALGALSAKSPQAQGMAGVGYRQALVDAIGAPKEGAVGTLNKIASGTNQGRNLAATFGEQPAESYRSALADEISRMENARFIDPRAGSKTASMAIDQDALGAIPKPTLWNIASVAVDKLRRGATLTDAERSAILTLSTGDAATGQAAIAPHLSGQQRWLSQILAPSIGRQAGGAAGQ